MSDINTINLKGKDYAPVSERIKALHSDHPKVNIDTDVEFKEGFAYVKAVVYIEERGSYSGHSFGELKKEKALEKLETVAVGRALAFAGYLAGGEIASYDEMEKWQDNSGMEI